jgi:TRAP-type mannitol/chloroaromatic compound transport system permease small subunit
MKEPLLQRYLLMVDSFSAWTGKIFGWSIVVLTLVTCFDVFMRYALRAPTDWGPDVSRFAFGTLFMMAGAYTLSRNAHVRGDMFYREWPVRTQAAVDIALYLLFFFPGIIALVVAGLDFANFARGVNERSSISPGGPVVWPFKYVIPIAGALMMLQGMVEIIRAAIAFRTGVWPERLSDVEETETRLAQESQL